MSPVVIKPDEVADVIRKLAEVRYQLLELADRLATPSAAGGSFRLAAEDVDDALDRVRRAAKLAVTPRS